ncbi:MAG TPA: DUF1269 domain-containing protein, partial [Amycolatopsis sp.]|nr:DUF1269 domain-containing protein [Amycolatopsis sp.]
LLHRKQPPHPPPKILLGPELAGTKSAIKPVGPQLVRKWGQNSPSQPVLACGGYLHGAVVVSKDLEGNLSVEQTDHMVREGAAGLGAVGFAVGLFAPPLLAATAIGAAIGAGAGKLLHHRTENKLEEQAGATIPVGGAGLIVAYPHSAAAKVEPVVTRAIKKVVGEAEGRHVKALKGAIADARKKMAESGA